MDLILWRHAEAVEGYPDPERALTEKGKKQAKLSGAWLSKHLPEKARILVSPAVRTRQTADGLKRPYDVSDAIRSGSTASGILRVAGWPDGDGTVVIVGHQPVLGQVAALILTGEPFALKIKKGAIWWFRKEDSEEGILMWVRPAVD